MIDCRDVHFHYPGESFALRVPRFSLSSGESMALVGPSGAGKTTLLRLVAGILVARSGRVRVDGTDLGTLSYPERQRFRIGRIGQVPQDFELLDYLTVEENILAPFRVAASLPLGPEAQGRARELADRTGIGKLRDRFPSQLSQGERQRVAICRGLVAEPSLVLADEPTGNLDPENQGRIVDLLQEETARIGASLLMITHETELRVRFPRVDDIRDLREDGSDGNAPHAEAGGSSGTTTEEKGGPTP